MVKEVKVHFIDNFQHVAIDVKIEMAIHKGPAEVLGVPKKIPECDPLRGNNADEYTYWAKEQLKEQYQTAHANTCQNKDTQEAWRICEAFDEECLKRRICLQGIDDDS